MYHRCAIQNSYEIAFTLKEISTLCFYNRFHLQNPCDQKEQYFHEGESACFRHIVPLHNHLAGIGGAAI